MKHRACKAFKIITLTAVLVTLVSLLVMNLWNALLPTLFNLPSIHFVQALGLLILSRLLFGGWRGPGFGAGFGPGPHWRRHLQARWDHLTPEQRAQLRQGMQQGRCNWRQPAADNTNEATPS